MNVHGLLYSQIGYDIGDPMRAIIRGPSRSHVSDGSTFAVRRATNGNEEGRPAEMVVSGDVRYWGETWNSHWWVIDFSGVDEPGEYLIEVAGKDGAIQYTSEGVHLGHFLLWEQTLLPVALEQMEERHRLARNGIGWRDCGAEWREANSHATMVIALCRVADSGASWLDRETTDRLLEQVVYGCDYLSILQDAGRQTGAPSGAVIHEIPNHMDIIPGDTAQSAVAFAYAARMLADIRPEQARELSGRAIAAMNYLLLEARPHRPDGFSHLNHGTPEEFVVPDEFMTRDLCMMLWGCVELYVGGHVRFKGHAFRLAREVMARQISESDAEGGTNGDPVLWGHFRTFESEQVSEKSNTHHHFGHDTGATWPHYIAPLADLCRWFPDHPDLPRWRECMRRFTEGYFIPACEANPFGILPIGYFDGVGLMSFCGPWHGFNTTISLAGSLARALEGSVSATSSESLRQIMTASLQWICGLHAGITQRSFEGSSAWKEEIPEDRAVPYSQISGIGRRSTGNWTGIRGTIPNGFCVNPQFQLVVPPSKEADEPLRYTDEDWIPHSAGYLLGLVALREKRRFG